MNVSLKEDTMRVKTTLSQEYALQEGCKISLEFQGGPIFKESIVLLKSYLDLLSETLPAIGDKIEKEEEEPEVSTPAAKNNFFLFTFDRLCDRKLLSVWRLT